MLDRLIRLIGIIFFCLAAGLIFHEVKTVGLAYLITLVKNTPMWITASAIGLTIVNYFILSEYDRLSLDYLGKKISYFDILKASWISFAISNTAGHVYLSGGSTRYLFYLPLGIARTDILKMVIFETITVFIGMATAYEISLWLSIFEPDLHLNDITGFAVIALLILCFFLLYWFCFVLPQKKLTVGQLSINIPDTGLTIKQIIIGLCDNFSLFLIFYSLIRYYLPVSFGTTFTVFIIAQGIGLVTQVPGGLGVFEGTFLYLFPHTTTQKSGILAALILFRFIYYILPFLTAGGYLGFRMIQKLFQSRSL
ncbi:MAG: UPF0104 family protein [Alphaproteobacteria bacterium]|nr:UPF0104 family protein [Alphaproteobacteria bacterium]